MCWCNHIFIQPQKYHTLHFMALKILPEKVWYMNLIKIEKSSIKDFVKSLKESCIKSDKGCIKSNINKCLSNKRIDIFESIVLYLWAPLPGQMAHQVNPREYKHHNLRLLPARRRYCTERPEAAVNNQIHPVRVHNQNCLTLIHILNAHTIFWG